MDSIHIPSWLEENEDQFLPPVCNKLMYSDGQMKLFFVGGPNQRHDYHIEDGEELFYMWKGDMCLKVIEGNQHKDIVIKEGEIFLLPGNVYHSPQRKADTIGWVSERERLPEEVDGLVYFTRDANGQLTTKKLFERYIHVEDLGTQLAPIIKEYFASEEHRTGQPVPENIVANPPVQYNPEERMLPPFNLKEWIAAHVDEIEENNGCLDLFPELSGTSQFLVEILGPGACEYSPIEWDVFLWVVSGTCQVEGDNELLVLNENDCTLIPANKGCTVTRGEDTYVLRCFQDASKRATFQRDQPGDSHPE